MDTHSKERLVILDESDLERLGDHIAAKVSEKVKALMSGLPHGNEMMTAQELADYLRVPLSNVRKRTRLNLLPYIRLSGGTRGLIRYKKSKIDEHFQKLHTPAVESPKFSMRPRPMRGTVV